MVLHVSMTGSILGDNSVATKPLVVCHAGAEQNSEVKSCANERQMQLATRTITKIRVKDE